MKKALQLVVALILGVIFFWFFGSMFLSLLAVTTSIFGILTGIVLAVGIAFWWLTDGSKPIMKNPFESRPTPSTMVKIAEKNIYVGEEIYKNWLNRVFTKGSMQVKLVEHGTAYIVIKHPSSSNINPYEVVAEVYNQYIFEKGQKCWAVTTPTRIIDGHVIGHYPLTGDPVEIAYYDNANDAFSGMWNAIDGAKYWNSNTIEREPDPSEFTPDDLYTSQLEK